ncbi:MAG: uroporphyrinogen-III C-methyltransferase [Gammaproteobacteria bacterium]
MSEGVKKQWSITLLWILTLLLAISMAGMAWEIKNIISNNSHAELTLAIEAQAKQLAAVTETMKRYDQQFQVIADHSNQVTAGLKSLDQSMREGNPAWRYAQVQFYLERAAQETYVMKDPVAARTWLQAALQNIINLNQPNLLSIQESIQQDIQDLSQQGAGAISQAMVSLSVLSDSVHTLPHKQAPEKMPQDTHNAPAATEKDDWRTAMKAGWNDLKSLVRVRTTDDEIVPYFSPDENAVIDQNVSLMLSQASFSAMRAQEKLYQQEIGQAIQWINRYYDTTSPSVQEALSTLDHLSKVNVTFNPPSKLKSFDAWSHFIQQSGQPA